MLYVLLLISIQLIIWQAQSQVISMKRSNTTTLMSTATKQVKEQLILQKLMQNYDQRIRPPSANTSDKSGPVIVNVNILIRMLSKIDVVNMEYSLQITFRERWHDRRLAYTSTAYANELKFLTVPHIRDHIWIPDSFFPTEKSAHRHLIDTENMFIRIYPDGQILYSVRLSLISSCPMQLQLYPLDVQHCDFDLISYAHTTKDIVYKWEEGEPVQLKEGVGNDLPNFILTSIDTSQECTSHTNTGSYACLRMRLMLTRKFSYYLIQLYLPTSMIVIVSWVSFWIDIHSTAGRIALGVTTLLTMTTLQSSINAKLPPVSYVKVVDIWLGACQTFVFGALIEYAFVSYKDSCLGEERKKTKENESIRESRRKKGKNNPQGNYHYEGTRKESFDKMACICDTVPDQQSFRKVLVKFFKRPSYLPDRIDFYARICVPSAFIIFNIFYWSICFHMKEQMN